MKLRISPGGTVTQATSKSTAVTINTPAGQITMNNAALAASTSVGFTVNNAYVGANDFVDLAISSGATAASYVLSVDSISAGSFTIHIRNVSAGSLGEAVVVSFMITKVSY